MRPTLANPRSDRVKAIRGLARRSSRLKAGRYVVDGPQGVREAVRYAAGDVVDVYLTAAAAARHTDIVKDATAAGLYLHEVTDEVLAAMVETDAPQGVLAVCRLPVEDPSARLEELLAGRPRLIAFLTHVRDPGNAGTVIRAADAAGADAVLVSDASVDVFGAKVVRSTAGSLFHLPVLPGLSVESTLARLRAAGLRLLAADGAGQIGPADLDLDTPHAWVFGNEAWGMPEPIRALCDEVVRVPIHGKAESLNLAMAATVCLYCSAGVIRE